MYDELSEADIQKMKEEIEHRKVVVRKEALAAVKEAREQGDLSENAEYDAAKDEQRDIELRIEEKTETKAESAILKEWSRQQKSSRIIPRMMRSD